MSTAKESFLIVFDFDHTVLDCNSDEVIPIGLGRKPFLLSLLEDNDDPHHYGKSLQWTNMMAMLMAPFSLKEIQDASAKYVTYHADMPPLLTALSALQQQHDSSSTGTKTELHIASDANTFFIEAILQSHFPLVKPRSTHSNPLYDTTETSSVDVSTEHVSQRKAYIDGLRTQYKDPLTLDTHPTRTLIDWYEPEPGHDCVACRANSRPHMCKSRIVLRCLEKSNLKDPTIIFVGDGGNDYCPVRQLLRPRDWMFARKGFPVSTALEKNEGGVCRVRQWSDAAELRCLFDQVVLQPNITTTASSEKKVDTLAAPLWAPLATMRDGNENEFRIMSLRKRFPALIRRTIHANQQLAPNRNVDNANELRTLFHDPVLAEKLNLLITSVETDDVPLVKLFAETSVSLALLDTVPQWTSAYGKSSSSAGCWCDLPWLHGEILFQHVLLQICMQHYHNAQQKHQVNISPYTGALVQGELPFPQLRKDTKGTILQSRPQFLFEEQGSGKPLPAGKQYPTTPSDNQKKPQFPLDIFLAEKMEALHAFFPSHILPMCHALQAARVAFTAEKKDAYQGDTVKFVTESKLLRRTLSSFLKSMLWANKVDLSMYSKDQVAAAAALHHNTTASNPVVELTPLEKWSASFERLDIDLMNNDTDPLVEYILTSVCLTALQTPNSTFNLDIVLDNSGVELAADLMFAVALLSVAPVNVNVRLHGKACPFYVSDTNEHDVAALLDMASNTTEEVDALRFGRDVSSHVENGRIQFYFEDPEWVSPIEFAELPPVLLNRFFYTNQLTHQKEEDPKLLRWLPTAKSALVVFKGDLDFRRLVGDRHFGRCFTRCTTNTTQDKVQQAYQEGHSSWQRVVGRYWPLQCVPVAALRTAKSEVSIGIKEDISRQSGTALSTKVWVQRQSHCGKDEGPVQERDVNQLSNGDLGLILFSGAV